jgi:hypothetical protein
MSRVALRGRAGRLALAAAALLLVAIGGVFVAQQPATATWTSLNKAPQCDCVEQSSDGKSYRAVFSYDNETKYTGRIEKGGNNAVFPKQIDGNQTTEFTAKGKSTFATGWVSNNQDVEWRVGGQTAKASSKSKRCDKKVSLPADGNGSGPVLALAVSLLIAGGVVLVRRRRLKLQEK